jgi:hypothetical protein
VLQFLLDVHIDPEVALQVMLHRPMCRAASLLEWRDGELRHKSDDEILGAAQSESWTVVTYDRSSIASLARELYFQGREHAGVIFVTGGTIRQGNVGALVRALMRLWDEEDQLDWSNRTHYLSPG